jgi:hypothetical protein
MKSKTFLVALLLLTAVAMTVYARDVICPLHSYASCYNTGEIASTGSGATKWHCTCGDDVWVAPEPPPQVTPSSPPPSPPAPIISPETQQQLNTAAGNLGAALGQAIARKRAQHQQEKNDMTAVVFCRQNPSGNWTFPNKAPMPCETLAKNVVAYCTVNPKTALCKDVAKLPPAATDAHKTQLQPVPPPPEQPQQQSQQASATVQPLQNLNASKPQPQPQMENVTATPPSEEISVAEAARRNKAAKEAAKAKENPQPQQ